MFGGINDLRKNSAKFMESDQALLGLQNYETIHSAV